MCMPPTDQVVQIFRQHLNSATHWVQTQVIQKAQQQGRIMDGRDYDACTFCWTRAIKIALHDSCQAAWGDCYRLAYYANNDALGIPAANDRIVCQHPNNHICGNCQLPGLAGGQRVYRHTFTCTCTCPAQNAQALLAAEVIWSVAHAAVRTRFVQLVAAGHPSIRVFVCNQDALQYDAALQCIRQGGDNQIGKTYLLVAFGTTPRNPRIVYYRIDAHQREAGDQCELAPIPEDYYLGWAVQLVQT